MDFFTFENFWIFHSHAIFFLRNVWYIFVGDEIPNYGQYPFECTCSWIWCTHIWISRSRPFMLNPELESFSAQRHLKRFIHVIKLTYRISDFWDVQGQNSNRASNSIEPWLDSIQQPFSKCWMLAGSSSQENQWIALFQSVGFLLFNITLVQ